MMSVLHFLTYFTLYNKALGSSTSLDWAQMHSLIWLSNIPPYTHTAASLSIHLSMNT